LQQSLETLTDKAKKDTEVLKEAKDRNATMQRINATLETKKELAEKSLQDKDNKLQASRKAEEVAKMIASELQGELKAFQFQKIN